MTARYLRFAQALALATVPACSSTADPSATEKEPPTHTVATDPSVIPPASKVAPKAADTVTSSEPSDETLAPSEEAGASATPPPPAELASVDAGETTDAGVETNIPHSSGPIVPPELPAGFAC